MRFARQRPSAPPTLAIDLAMLGQVDAASGRTGLLLDRRRPSWELAHAMGQASDGLILSGFALGALDRLG